MLIGIGIDLLEVDRMAEQLRPGASAFREQVFTPAEIAYCESQHYPSRHYAARFAAKEAVLKALGTGARDASAWREVEVWRDGQGACGVRLHGQAQRLATERNVRRIHVSLTHTRGLAAASVALES